MVFTEDQIKDLNSQGISINKTSVINTYLGSLTQAELKDINNVRMILGRTYEEIKALLKLYVDMEDKYYHFTALWIIGTYVHDSFTTFPILYINAMRGSGKTRFMNLIAALSKNGLVTSTPKEAVLFRMGKKTLCIDEAEQIGNKEFQTLRELLNACYKKGLKVLRNKKVKVGTNDEYVIEEFEPYKPVVIANISGLEEILEDRAITIILEKSNDLLRTKLREDFENHPIVNQIKSNLDQISVNLVQFLCQKGIIIGWNIYLLNKYSNINTLTTLTSLTTQDLENYKESLMKVGVVLEGVGVEMEGVKNEVKNNCINYTIYNQIDEIDINGRNLELIMPFLEISHFLSDDLFKKTLTITKKIIDEKKERESVESRDVAFIEYCARLGIIERDYISIKVITSNFRHYLGDDEGDERWINTKWIGRALKRLSLIKEKRRLNEGIEVIVDIDKAIEKMRMFRK